MPMFITATNLHTLLEAKKAAPAAAAAPTAARIPPRRKRTAVKTKEVKTIDFNKSAETKSDYNEDAMNVDYNE